MDPIDLEPDELEYELLIRQIYGGIDKPRQKTSRIRELMKEEDAGRLAPPGLGTSPWLPSEDIKHGMNVLKQISKRIKTDNVDKQEAKENRSRVIHVETRLLRIQTNDPHEKSIISQLLVEAGRLLEILQLLSAPKPKKIRGRRETITERNAYQLEHSDPNINRTNRSDPITYERVIHRETIYDTPGETATGGVSIEPARGAIPKSNVDQPYKASSQQTSAQVESEKQQLAPNVPQSAPLGHPNNSNTVQLQSVSNQNLLNPFETAPEDQRRSTSHSDLLQLNGAVALANNTQGPTYPSNLDITAREFYPPSSRAAEPVHGQTDEQINFSYMSNARHQADNYDILDSMIKNINIRDTCESSSSTASDNYDEEELDRLRRKYTLLKNSLQNRAPKKAGTTAAHLPPYICTTNKNVGHYRPTQYDYFNNTMVQNAHPGFNHSGPRAQTNPTTAPRVHIRPDSSDEDDVYVNEGSQNAQNHYLNPRATIVPIQNANNQLTYTINRSGPNMYGFQNRNHQGVANNSVHSNVINPHQGNFVPQNSQYGNYVPQNRQSNNYGPQNMQTPAYSTQTAWPPLSTQQAQFQQIPPMQGTQNMIPFNQNMAYPMHAHFRPITMDKWKVQFSYRTPVKEGEVGLHQFIEQVEMHTQANCMHPDVVASQIGILLKGPALEWFLRNRTTITGWSDLVSKMKRKFLSATYQLEALDEITNRKQKEEESVSNFISDMIKRFSTLPEPMKENFQSNMIQNNLRPKIKKKLVSQRFTKISKLEESAKNVERNLPPPPKYESQAKPKYSSKHSRAKVYECNAESDKSESTTSDEKSEKGSSDDEIYAIQKLVKDYKKIIKKGKYSKNDKGQKQSQADASKMICFKCKKAGHGFRQCPDASEKFFCFICGKDDVITPKCPNCNPKNEKADSQARESKPQ